MARHKVLEVSTMLLISPLARGVLLAVGVTKLIAAFLFVFFAFDFDATSRSLASLLHTDAPNIAQIAEARKQAAPVTCACNLNANTAH